MAEVLNLVHGQAKDTSCQINLFGATLTSWKVEGVENIFVSSKAALDGSKAIRGGIPICFPSFGPWEFGAQHGFARNSKNWRVAKAKSVDERTGDVSLSLVLEDDSNSREIWAGNKFAFVYNILLKNREIELSVDIANNGANSFNFTFALHTYFKVPDVKACKVTNLKGLTFIDKTKGGALSVEDREEVLVQEFTDRLYQKAPNTCELKGLQGGRAIRLTKENIADVCVWNPWSLNAAKMSDFDDEEYKKMICVEAVQFSSPISLKPKENYKAKHILTVVDTKCSQSKI